MPKKKRLPINDMIDQYYQEYIEFLKEKKERMEAERKALADLKARKASGKYKPREK